MISQPPVEVNHNGNTRHSAIALSPYQQSIRVLELTVQLLIARTNMGEYWAEGFRDLGKLLAALHIPTAEFTSVTRHLQNAVSYCQDGEIGASTFELRAVRGTLQRL